MSYLAIAIPRKELGGRAEARNKEIQRCLSLGADYILMMDTDQAMPMDAVLGSDIDDHDIVVIDAPSKDGLSQTNVTYHPDGTLAFTGFGCAIFKSEIFRRLPKPWFDSSYSYTFEIKGGKYVLTRQDKYKDDNVGEDTNFFFKCLENRININIITKSKCIHKDINETTSQN